MPKKILLFLFLFIYAAALFSQDIQFDQENYEENNRSWVTVQASSSEERTAISLLGMTIDEFDDTTVSGIASQEIIDQLTNQHFTIYSCESLEAQYKKILPQLGVNAYHFLNYQKMVKKIQKLAAKHPDIVSYFSAGTSIQGRELFVIRINLTEKGMVPSAKPGIFLVGNHHAREHITAEFCMQCAKYIANNQHDPSLRLLIANRDIFIMPMANPDGIDYDLSGFPFRFHRKNMRPLINHALGVDLNRNYDLNWGGTGASKQVNNESYCGERPFSEPETQAIKQLIESHENIRILISYHSFGKIILYPWGYTRKQITNATDFQHYKTLTKEMLARLPDYRTTQASEMYIVSGETADWAYASKNIVALTIEMMPRIAHSANGFYPTDKREIEDDIEHNIAAAMFAIEFAGNVL